MRTDLYQIVQRLSPLQLQMGVYPFSVKGFEDKKTPKEDI
jgi:hypothetical protein